MYLIAVKAVEAEEGEKESGDAEESSDVGKSCRDSLVRPDNSEIFFIFLEKKA